MINKAGKVIQSNKQILTQPHSNPQLFLQGTVKKACIPLDVSKILSGEFDHKFHIKNQEVQNQGEFPWTIGIWFIL